MCIRDRGERVKIGAGCVIKNSTIGDDCEISPYSVVEDAHLQACLLYTSTPPAVSWIRWLWVRSTTTPHVAYSPCCNVIRN